MLEHHQIVTRKDALARDLKKYFTGRPCRHKHVDYRLVSTRVCQACALAQQVAAQTNAPILVLALLLGTRHANPSDYLCLVGVKIPSAFEIVGTPFWQRLFLPEVIDGVRIAWSTPYGRVSCGPYDRTMSHHELRRRATPRWADLRLIQAFYDERDRLQKSDNLMWVVDHIIPLCHGDVCGLHVHTNLQVITMLENTRRRGMFAGETTVFDWKRSGWDNFKKVEL